MDVLGAPTAAGYEVLGIAKGIRQGNDRRPSLETVGEYTTISMHGTWNSIVRGMCKLVRI